MANQQYSAPPTGWEVRQPPEHPGVMIATQGEEKTGKTDWALQLPKPLAYLSMDRKRKGDRLYPDGVVEPEASPYRVSAITEQSEADDLLERIQLDIRDAIAGSYFRSLVIDTGTMLWDIVRLSELGAFTGVAPERYDKPKAVFRGLIEEIEDANINCVITHKTKKEYRAGEGSDWRGNWTGNYERAGFGEIGFMVHHTLVHSRGLDEDGSTTFQIRVADSTHAVAIGRTFDSTDNDPDLDLDVVSFPEIAAILEPNTKPDYWR